MCLRTCIPCTFWAEVDDQIPNKHWFFVSSAYMSFCFVCSLFHIPAQSNTGKMNTPTTNQIQTQNIEQILFKQLPHFPNDELNWKCEYVCVCVCVTGVLTESTLAGFYHRVHHTYAYSKLPDWIACLLIYFVIIIFSYTQWNRKRLTDTRWVDVVVANRLLAQWHFSNVLSCTLFEWAEVFFCLRRTDNWKCFVCDRWIVWVIHSAEETMTRYMGMGHMYVDALIPMLICVICVCMLHGQYVTDYFSLSFHSICLRYSPYFVVAFNSIG